MDTWLPTQSLPLHPFISVQSKVLPAEEEHSSLLPPLISTLQLPLNLLKKKSAA